MYIVQVRLKMFALTQIDRWLSPEQKFETLCLLICAAVMQSSISTLCLSVWSSTVHTHTSCLYPCFISLSTAHSRVFCLVPVLDKEVHQMQWGLVWCAYSKMQRCLSRVLLEAGVKTRIVKDNIIQNYYHWFNYAVKPSYIHLYTFYKLYFLRFLIYMI